MDYGGRSHSSVRVGFGRCATSQHAEPLEPPQLWQFSAFAAALVLRALSFFGCDVWWTCFLFVAFLERWMGSLAIKALKAREASLIL
ncbi:hypothetical protein K432DRAFT_377665 [Lepidopterella palustris CBS 459.81]|uniref:Uncharacterized protein n=1 Tax=Lepidopterella palustris CBS 459.81 TaxID=1314670 RepID=A0A8E2EKF1_9PEZI|nr:hypothetical protein K432DRAFT_377665 [Lepidopterella palustris CBS 459.81]